MNEYKETNPQLRKLEQEKIQQPPKRRGPGRGIGEKRITLERIEALDTLFNNLQQVHNFLAEQGHLIINESGSLLASQSHQNLDQLLHLLEDFLWILNCAIAKIGGKPKLF